MAILLKLCADGWMLCCLLFLVSCVVCVSVCVVPATFIAGVLANINGTNVRPLLLNVNLPGNTHY